MHRPKRLPSVFPWLRHVFANRAYAAAKLTAALSQLGEWTLEIVKCSEGAKGFVLLPRRWVVEQTLAWFNRNRWFAKDFEAAIECAQTWLVIVSVKLLTPRLART